MNLKETFESIQKIKEIIEARARQQFEARGNDLGPYSISEIEFEEDYVNVTFKEITHYDPYSDNIHLSIAELEMTDDEWNIFITEITQNRLKKEQEKLLQKKENELKEQERLIKFHQEKLKDLQSKRS